jgi:NAD(P)-dependent dehydrogenase (short-subunit alcohol dehydrogenase family)
MIMNDFKEKVVIITGAASGIGRALSEALCREKAIVVAADVNQEGLEDVASITNKEGGRVILKVIDVSSSEDVKKLINETVSENGRIDYIFNNAGLSISGETHDLTLEHWQKVIGVNLMGVIYGTTYAYSVMVRQKFGHIINIASLAGLIGYPMNTPYATTKYGVVGLSTSLREEGADLGVKVSVVCPGYVDTGIFDAAVMINVDKKQLMDNLPFKLMEVKKAAEKILKGVVQNKAIITFPFYTGLLWKIHRLHPGLLSPLGRKTVREFRKSKI